MNIETEEHMNIGPEKHMTIGPDKHMTIGPEKHMTMEPSNNIIEESIKEPCFYADNKTIGRPKKKRGFKSTPIKSKSCNDHIYDQMLTDRDTRARATKKQNYCNKSIDFNITPTYTNTIPLGLLNRGENVCFFNSIMQVLYALPAFCNYVHELSHSDQYVMTIKEMFEEIANSNAPVRSSKYIRDLRLHNYVFGSQYDAHECLLQILNKIYSSVTNDCLFKISVLESTVCQSNNCQHRAERSIDMLDLELNIFPSGAVHTVTNLLNQPQIPSPLEGYRCDGCKVVGSCTKADLITHTSDVLIIQLKIFEYSNKHNMIKKKNPNVNIEEEILVWGNWILHGIIFHEGDHANSGHYTCGIKKKDKWFMISDSSVTQKQMKLSYRAQDYSVPYILFYKKVNSRGDNATELFNIQPAMEEEVKTLYKIPSLNKTTSALQKEQKTSTSYLEFGDLSNFNSEMMNRKSILKELELQKERILNSNKRKDESNLNQSTIYKSKKVKTQSVINESPIKRKRRYSKISSTNKMKEDARKRMKELRSNLKDADKNSLKCSEKERLRNIRKNLDDVSKIKLKDSAKKQNEKCA